MPSGAAEQQAERLPLLPAPDVDETAEPHMPQRTSSRSSAGSSDAGPPSAAAGASSAPAAAAAAAAAAASPRVAAAINQDHQVPLCRICLEEDDPQALERPCNCSGTMQFAHHECIQKWVDEKHDLKCELCGAPYRCRRRLREPPPRPRPHPLVAQLQVDNNDNRIVLLADPETGAIVARVVIPPGEEPLEARAALERWRRTVDEAMAAEAAAGRAQAEEEEAEEGERACACDPSMSLAVVALLVVVALGTCYWLASAAEEGGGEAAAGYGAWMVRIVLLAAWLSLRAVRPVPRPQRLERRRPAVFVDLEAGLGPHRRGGGH